ncbi:TetR/AcrR family transcriptional regulator C-terminal domain-containing protein [Leifsonia lichenia]
MTAPEAATSGSKGRKRGGPLRIDRTRIIDVAKRFDPQTLTMQAVADELGVDRKALNYHVTDRDTLLRLVAEEAFESAFADAFSGYFTVDDGGTADWRDALRAWAVAVRDSMVATGVLVTYFRINSDNLAIFEPIELVLRRLHAAGFDETSAGRAVIFATHFAMAVGRDILMQNQLGGHPQSTEVMNLLAKDEAAGGYEGIRGLASAGLNGPADIGAQFDYELDVFIRGLERSMDA